MARWSAAAPGIVLVVIGIVTGAGVGYLVGVSPTEGEAAAPATSSRIDAEPGAAEQPVVPERGAVRGRSPPRARTTLPAPHVETAATPRGEGRITGTVCLPDDSPLAGVLVRATPRIESETDAEMDIARRSSAMSPPPPDDVEEEIRQVAAQLRRQVAGRREATTDASGTYSLEALGESVYDVAAWRAGCRIERAGSRYGPVTVGGRCDFRATPVVSLAVSVLLPDGSPPEQAEVAWRPASGGDGEAWSWSPKLSDVEVPPGTYEFVASANLPRSGSSSRYRALGRRRDPRSAADALYRSEPTTVTVDTGAPEALAFRLLGRPGVLVRLVHPSADRPRYVRIAAVKIGPGMSTDPARLLSDDGVRASWLTDATEGALTRLERGTYLVGATFHGGLLGPSATVTVADELVTQELVVSERVRDWVKVWIRSHDGTPVTEAEIECGCRGSDGSGCASVAASAEADGSFHVAHYEREAPSSLFNVSTTGSSLGSGPRTYFVRANSALHGSAEATYVPGKDAEITLRMTAPAVVRVHVEGHSEFPERNRLTVALEAKDLQVLPGRNRVDPVEIDERGVARPPAVRPGAYDVVLRLAEGESRQYRRIAYWNGAELARVPVTLAAGPTDVTMSLAGYSDLVVTFEGEKPRLQRVAPDGSIRGVERRAAPSSVRDVTFQSLAPGRYRVVSGAGAMWVDVPAGGCVSFVPRPFDAFHLTVYGKSYLRELGLSTGDLVVAIDGVEFRDAVSAAAAMATAKTRESSSFAIVRGAERFAVTADGKRFEEDEGSLYQPWTK